MCGKRMSDEPIGTDMKKVVLALSSIMLAACMPYSSMTSPDPDMRLDGDEPEGYPRTVVVHYKGSCYRATESWSKADSYTQVASCCLLYTSDAADE